MAPAGSPDDIIALHNYRAALLSRCTIVALH